MTKSEKKIAELERRVKELEARPQILILPQQPYIVQPFYPVYPMPWNQPQITCGNGTFFTGSNL